MTKDKKYELHKTELDLDAIYNGSEFLTQEEVIDLLSEQDKRIKDLDDTRLRKNREIAKLKAREELYQRVIGGLKAYLELECNNELWWDWNE